MVLTFINPNVIVMVMLALFAFASPRADANISSTTPSRSMCANIQTLTDPQSKGMFTMLCTGSSVAAYVVAERIKQSQIMFIGQPTGDGRYNVAIQWELGDLPNLPNCDFGQNYYLTAQFEMPDPTGKRMEINQRCILRVLSAAELLRMVGERLAERGILLDNADWELVQETSIAILRELAAATLAR